MKLLAPVVLAALLPGCASALRGTNDDVTVATAPAGATCTLERRGQRLGEIAATPGTLRVSKSQHDIAVVCARPGWLTARATVRPTESYATMGNLLAGGLIGLAVDASTGAGFSYPRHVSLNLAPDPAAPRARAARRRPGA